LETDFGAGDLKLIFPPYLVLYPLQQRALKLDNLTTAKADQVVVFGRASDLIVVMIFAEVALLYQAKLLKQPQVAIYRGQAYPGLTLPSPAEEFIGIQMPSSLGDKF
jgi:hypothetical protein